MSARLAGRLLTSPVAFLAAGLLDFGLFGGATIWRAVCSLAHRMFTAVPKIAPR